MTPEQRERLEQIAATIKRGRPTAQDSNVHWLISLAESEAKRADLEAQRADSEARVSAQAGEAHDAAIRERDEARKLSLERTIELGWTKREAEAIVAAGASPEQMRESLKNFADGACVELTDILAGVRPAPTLADKLKAERDEALAACAALRGAVGKADDAVGDGKQTLACTILCDALQSDAGRLVWEAIRKAGEACRAIATAWMGSHTRSSCIQGCHVCKAEDALAALRKAGVGL